MALTYFKTPLEPHAVHQSKTTKTDGRWEEAPGERGLYLSFTATMEHVRFALLLLFTHTVCISLLENYIASCLRAIDWVTGPHSILTDVSLAIFCMRGAPLTLASGRCIIQTGRGKWGLYFHQSHQDILKCFAVLANQILLYQFKCSPPLFLMDNIKPWIYQSAWKLTKL